MRERPRGGVFEYISPSRLNLWLRCPLAFRFRYVDGVESPTTPAAFLGKVVHAVLEYVYLRRKRDEHPSLFEACWFLSSTWPEMVVGESMTFGSPAEEQALCQQAAMLIRTYFEHFAAETVKPIAVERRYSAPLIDPETGENLGIPMVGVVDLVTRSPDGPFIVDFKTTARGGTPLDIVHELQLTAYSYLYRYEHKQEEGGLEIRNLVKTKTPRISSYRWPPREARHFRRLFATIRAYLDSLHAGNFVFRPQFMCSSCDFRDSHCNSWCA